MHEFVGADDPVRPLVLRICRGFLRFGSAFCRAESRVRPYAHFGTWASIWEIHGKRKDQWLGRPLHLRRLLLHLSGGNHAGSSCKRITDGERNAGAFEAERPCSLCLRAAGAGDPASLRTVAAALSARAGGLGVARRADRRQNSCHALGKPHRPRQGLRRDARLPHHFAYPRGAHAL